MSTDTAKPSESAAARYAAQVDAVLAQRARLRGPEPSADLFDGLSPDHLLMKAEARGPLSANVAVIASYIEPQDVIIDVGGGAGRISLPLALLSREVVNVDPSEGMGKGFLANAARAGVTNVRFIAGEWQAIEPPAGTLALVNHVTYLTRVIVPFLLKLEKAGTRRVIVTVNRPPPPYRQHRLYGLVYGEPEARIPGHESLMNVLWELGIQPDLIVLPETTNALRPAPTRETAIAAMVASFQSEQWSFWPYPPGVEEHVRNVVETRFDELFRREADGFYPLTPGREVLITWRPGIDVSL